MQSIDGDGQRIAYERAGAGAPIVLVHGYVGDGPSTWRPQLDRLAGEFDVIALDLPGADGSSDPPAGFGINGYASCVAQCIDALDLVLPHVVGLSPRRSSHDRDESSASAATGSITLVGAYAGWGGSLPPEEDYRRLRQALELAELPAPGTHRRPAPDDVRPVRTGRRGGRASESRWRGSTLLDSRHGRSKHRRPDQRTPRHPDPAIQVPTLLVYGADDTRAPRASPTSCTVPSPSPSSRSSRPAGHVCNTDAADEFNRIVADFARRHRQH